MSREKVTRLMSAMTEAIDLTGGGQEPPLQAPPKAPSPADKPSSTGYRLAYRLGASVPLGGALSWVVGVAAHTGYHVSVPFLPTWLIFIVATVAAGHFSGLLSAAWHYEKGKSAVQLASQIRAAELFAEHTAPAILKQLNL